MRLISGAQDGEVKSATSSHTRVLIVDDENGGGANYVFHMACELTFKAVSLDIESW